MKINSMKTTIAVLTLSMFGAIGVDDYHRSCDGQYKNVTQRSIADLRLLNRIDPRGDANIDFVSDLQKDASELRRFDGSAADSVLELSYIYSNDIERNTPMFKEAIERAMGNVLDGLTRANG